MKALILKQSFGEYDSYEERIEGIYFVPDDFNYQSYLTLREEWLNLGWQYKIISRGKYKGQMTKKKYPVSSFEQWLGNKFTSIPMIEIEY